jgi:hypothetical protein
MAQVMKYASDVDGKLFDSEEEQRAYDAGLKHQAKIGEFLDKHYPRVEGKKSGPARALVGAGIAKWLSQPELVA